MYGYKPGLAQSADDSYTHMALQESADEELQIKNSEVEALSSQDSTQSLGFLSGLREDWFDVQGDKFNAMMAIVIVANAILISAETDRGVSSTYDQIENLLTCIFTVEMVMRMYQLRRMWYRDVWNIFDFVLVSFSIVGFFLSSFLGIDHQHTTKKALALRLCRLIRVLRFLRILRFFTMFHDLLLILHAFERAMRVVLWLMMLIFLLNWMVAIVLTQGVGHNSDWWADVGKADMILKWFGDIRCSFQSLFIIMTLAEWDEMAYTLSEVLPPFPVFLAFMSYILMASYTMVSLITGIISESLVSAQQADLVNKMREIESERQAFALDLHEILSSLDGNGNGYIDADEVSHALASHPNILTRLHALDIHIDLSGILTLVERLAEDGQGVHIPKLVESMANLTGQAKASSVVDLKYDVKASIAGTQSYIAKLFVELREDLNATRSFLRDQALRRDEVRCAEIDGEYRRGSVISNAGGTKRQAWCGTSEAATLAELACIKAILENQMKQQILETTRTLENLSSKVDVINQSICGGQTAQIKENGTAFHTSSAVAAESFGAHPRSIAEKHVDEIGSAARRCQQTGIAGSLTHALGQSQWKEPQGIYHSLEGRPKEAIYRMEAL